MRSSLSFFAVILSSVVGCGGPVAFAPPDDPGLIEGDTGVVIEQEDTAPPGKKRGDATGVEEHDSATPSEDTAVAIDSGVDAPVDTAPDVPPAKPLLVPSNAALFGELRNNKLKLTTPSMAAFDTSSDCTGTTMIGECTSIESTTPAPES